MNIRLIGQNKAFKRILIDNINSNIGILSYAKNRLRLSILRQYKDQIDYYKFHNLFDQICQTSLIQRRYLDIHDITMMVLELCRK